MKLENYIAKVKDYPKKGIMFRDITPLMANGKAFKEATNKFVEIAKKLNVDVIVGPEARGFIFGCPVATQLELGFIPVRKPNKLPREAIELEYKLEYGTNTLCMHKDAITQGQRVLIIDDLLATGGTIDATIKLVEQLGGVVVGLAFLIELEELEGRKKINKDNIFSLIKY